MSLVEASVILVVLSVLTAVAAPAIDNYLSEARQTKAREDVEAIASAITQFLVDTGENSFMIDAQPLGVISGDGPDHTSTNLVKLLVSDGDTPVLGVARSVGAPPDWNSARNEATTATVQTLSEHLVQNKPTSTSANAYRNANGMSVLLNFDPTSGRTFNSEYAWRGPYLSGPVDPDPWGHRYAVNVEFLAHVAGTNGPEGNVNDVYVLCAGPDGETDTRFNVDGVTPGDDDIIQLVQGGTHS